MAFFEQISEGVNIFFENSLKKKPLSEQTSERIKFFKINVQILNFLSAVNSRG